MDHLWGLRYMVDMNYSLNFITTTVDQWQRLRIQRFTLFLYLLIIFATGFIFYKLYDSVDYMATVISIKADQIEKQISEIEPQVILLENKINKRNAMTGNTKFYSQIEQRPGLWYARLKDISSNLPAKMIIKQIEYVSDDLGDTKQPPKFSLTGHIVIQNNEKDIFMVDEYKNVISESPYIKYIYDNVNINNNNIYKENDDLKLTFSMVFEK